MAIGADGNKVIKKVKVAKRKRSPLGMAGETRAEYAEKHRERLNRLIDNIVIEEKQRKMAAGIQGLS